MDLLREFFSSNGFMPHGTCLLWNPRLIWLHVLSDALIFAAYLSIPFTLLDVARRFHAVSFRWMFWCFAAFIVSCGLTHGTEIWTLWHPDYWLQGGIKAITAIASVATAFLLVKLARNAIRGSCTIRREIATRLAPDSGGSDGRMLWLAHGLAVVITVTLLILIQALGPEATNNPPVIVFLIPIIFSAYLGGLIPGLVSTALNTSMVVYFVLPPVRVLSVSSPADNIKWITLALTGALISVMSEALHRAGTERAREREHGLLLSTERKVRLGFGFLLFCLIAIGAVSYRSVVKLREDMGRVEHSHQVLAQLRTLLFATTEASDGWRGYAITGGDEYLKLYQSAGPKVNAALRDLRALTQDDAVQQRRLDVLDGLVASRLAGLSEDVELRRRLGFAAAQKATLGGKGEAIDDQIRSAVARMESIEEDLLRQREDRAQRATGVTKLTILAAGTLGLVMALAALFGIGQGFTISRQADTALRQAKGDLENRVAERTAELVESNRRLQHELEERKRTQEALRESHERLKKVLEVETVGVMFWDLTSGCMTDANDAFLNFMGYSRREVEARELTWQKLTPPEYMEVSRQEVEKFMATGRVGPYEKEYLHKDGTRQWFVFAGTSLGNNVCVEFCVDISDRKKAEAALRESEAQFRTLANAIPQLCWMANPDGQIFWYNQRWYDYTRTTPEDMKGWGWQSVHDPEELPKVLERWKESIATGKAFDMVFPLRGADGIFRPFLTRVMPVRDQDGKVARWFGTNTDISEQRRIEEALRQSEDQLRTLGDNLPAGAIYRYRHDPSGQPHVDFISAGIEQLTGVPAAEYMLDAATINRNTLSEDLDRFNSAIVLSREELTRFEVELRHQHRSTGEIRWSLLRSTPTRRPDGSTVWDGIELDITERKLAEAARSQLAAIVESSDDAIVGKTLEGVITSWNRGAERLYGFSAEEAMGQPVSIVIPPERRDEMREILEGIRSGRPVEHLETLRCRKDGIQVDVSLTVSPIQSADGKVTGASSIARDITERKRAEEALAQKAFELARSNADLEQFAYVASHDLQEPLRMVASFTQLLGKRYRGKLDPEADEFIAYAVDGASRMQVLINDLLSYSRVGTRGKKLAPTNCEAVLDEALMNLRTAIEETGAVVTHDPLPTVPADAAQLRQLLQNLVGNALKFHGSRPPRVHVGVQSRRGEWCFSVQDNGIGIEPRHAERIFQVFQRLHTATEYPGTGIGLAIAKKIVERHGGRIWVDAEPGKGATFYFTLGAVESQRSKVES